MFSNEWRDVLTEFLKIKEITSQAVRQNDCRVYDIYKHRDRLQVFIDKQSKEHVVNLKDCENVFHSLRFLLRSALPHILEKRYLEVSTPGIEKPLREKWHFEESIGERIQLSTNSPITAQNRKTGVRFRSQSFKAQLISVSQQKLNLQNPFMECEVPFSEIKSARLLFPFKNSASFSTKKRGIQNKKRGGSHVS